MGARIATGAIGGVLLLLALQYDPFIALAVTALLHALAIYEYTRLDTRLPARAVALFVLGATVVFCVASLALVKLLSAELALALAAILVIATLAGDLFSYDRTGQAGQYAHLARAVLCITLPFSFVAPIANWPGGFPYLLLLFGASFGTDVGGIWVGKLIGRRQLAPRLSPKKTVEGLIGGLLAAAACWVVTTTIWPLSFTAGAFDLEALPTGLQLALVALAAMVTALFGIAGDLTFSLFKRQAGIKDYGALLPGHGGILDRFDAFIFCAPLVFLICLGLA
jgi:phosphatidate cytidylyltransferase